MFRNIAKILVVLLLIFSAKTDVLAGNLTSVQDFLTDSRPSALSGHTFVFYTTNIVPVSGRVVITPSAGNFNIESGLDFNDLDLLVNNSQRTLGSSPGSGAGSQTGVSVTTGTSGAIVFTLNDTDAIPAGSLVEIRVGTTTTLGGPSTKTIQLPTSAGSYSIDLKTQNSASVDIDSMTSMIFVTPGVGVSASNVSPSPSPTPTPTPSPTPSPSPQGGGVVVPSIVIDLPEIDSSADFPLTFTNPSGSILITNDTSTVNISPGAVNSLSQISIPLFGDRNNVLVFPIDSENKVIITIPSFSVPPGDNLYLIARKVDFSEISSVLLPPDMAFVGDGIYSLSLYSEGKKIDKFSKPITVSVFYDYEGFLPESVGLYSLGAKNQSRWQSVDNLFRSPSEGLITAKKLYELNFLSVLGKRTTGLSSTTGGSLVTPPSGLKFPLSIIFTEGDIRLPRILFNFDFLLRLALLITSLNVLLVLLLVNQKRYKK